MGSVNLRSGLVPFHKRALGVSLGVLILWLTVSVVYAAGSVDELLEVSGLRQQFVVSVGRVRSQYAAGGPGSLTAKERAEVVGVVERTMTPDALYGVLRAEVARRVEFGRIERALAWYRSPLGARIVGVEVASAAELGGPVMEAYLAGLQTNPPSAERLARIERLDAVSGGSRAAVEMALAVARGMATAVNDALPPGRRTPREHVEREVTAGFAQAAEMVRQGVLIATLFTYRNIDDTELDAYIRFVESDTGQWMVAAVHSGLRLAFERAGADTGRALARIIPPERLAPRRTAPTR